MNDWFDWNGTRCTTKGIHVLEQPTYTLPAERSTFTAVPGRSGSLTTLEGDEVYDDIVLTATCIIDGESRIPTLSAWLKGGGTVTFANRPGGFYKARIVNQIVFEKILRGNPHRKFAVNFRCQPFWYQSNSNDMYRRVIWQCNRKFSKSQEQCKTPHLTEDAIKEMFLKAYNRLMRQRKQLIEDCKLMKSLLTDCAEQEAGMEQLRQEIEEIAYMTRNLVRQNTRRTQSQEAHNAKYNALAERCEKASAKHDKPEAEIARRKKGAANCRIHRPAGKATASLEEWDSQVWSPLPEKGTVNGAAASLPRARHRRRSSVMLPAT